MERKALQRAKINQLKKHARIKRYTITDTSSSVRYHDVWHANTETATNHFDMNDH